MQYLLLIYSDEKQWEALPKTEWQAVLEEYRKFTESVKASGHYRAGEALQPTSTATTVRVRDARVLSGGTATLSDAWGSLIYRVGADTKTASDEQSSRAEIVQQVELLREQVSGVSLDEEAMMMMKFQRAYEANARFFQAIDSALDTLLSLHK